MNSKKWYAAALDLVIGIVMLGIFTVAAGFIARPVVEVFLMGWRAWG